MPRHVARTEILLWSLVILLLFYALSPALTRSHVEGFSYFTETMAMLLPDRAAADPLWPLNRDYFYLSRPGVVWAIAPLAALSPGNGYDILMWIAMPVFLSGLVVAARMLSGASWLACVAVLLLLPVALDTSFFLNDNLIATGLSLWAMVALLGTRGSIATLGAGALYSLAILCRLDQVLLGPFLAVLAVLHAQTAADAARRLGAMALGFGLVHGGFALVDPGAANLLGRIALVSAADAQWDRDAGGILDMVAGDLSSALLAFGIALPAIFAGARHMLRRSRSEAAGDLRRIASLRVRALPLLLIGYPVFIYALTVGKYYDPRGFLTMLPMLAALGALGLQRWVFGPVLNSEKGSVSHGARRLLPAAGLLALFAVPSVALFDKVPQLQEETENAPPTVTGRIWYTESWRRWQARDFHLPERATGALVETFVDTPDPVVVVTSQWTEDRRLQNALAVRGFVPGQPTLADCTGAVEAWTHASGAVVHHLRTHVPFLEARALNTAAVMLIHGNACLTSVPDDRRFAARPYGALVSPTSVLLALEPGSDGHYRLTDADVRRLALGAEETIRAHAAARGGGASDPADLALEILADAEARLK